LEEQILPIVDIVNFGTFLCTGTTLANLNGLGNWCDYAFCAHSLEWYSSGYSFTKAHTHYNLRTHWKNHKSL